MKILCSWPDFPSQMANPPVLSNVMGVYQEHLAGHSIDAEKRTQIANYIRVYHTLAGNG
ncbi:hypothetical protein [Salinimonas sediminis]|uniref:hypothetical protein n=1 Tax=Salinimonas sediminis TaxID=2303538 RepID=UPI001C3FC3FF|nr:hypothetical protein [Salinimonas sediminis]